MAKAIPYIERPAPDPAAEEARALADLAQAAAHHRDALLQGMELLGELRRAGVLDILEGLLKNRTEVGEIAVQQLNQPRTHRLVKNGIIGLQFLGSLDPDRLHNLTDSLSRGMEKASAGGDKTGLRDWIRAVRSPEVRSALAMMTRFLEGLGEMPHRAEGKPPGQTGSAADDRDPHHSRKD